MTAIDWPTLINWIASSLIGCVFGIVTSYFVFRLDRIRDKERHEKEIQNLQLQFENDKSQLVTQFENEKALLEIKISEENKARERAEQVAVLQSISKSLTVGLSDPAAEIAKLQKASRAMVATDNVTLFYFQRKKTQEKRRRLKRRSKNASRSSGG